MENKNKGLIIVVVLLVLVVLGLVCYICYDKGVFGRKKESSNNGTETKAETLDKEQDYNKETAKELIDKYYYTTNSPDKNLFTEGMTDVYKKYKAVKNLSMNDFQTIDENKKMIEYDVLNKKYQYLFGKNENIEKKDFEYLLSTWKYDISKDSFILYETVGGGNLIGPYFSTYGIQSAKVSGENLIIDVGYVFLKPTDTVKISGEEVSFTEAEIQKAGFEKDFLDKYLDKLDTYEFTFKYEDDHYVFVDMQKK